jgi:hypothetical protein
MVELSTKQKCIKFFVFFIKGGYCFFNVNFKNGLANALCRGSVTGEKALLYG